MDDWRYRPAGDLGLPPGEGFKSVKREAGLVAHGVQSLWRAIAQMYLQGFHRFTVAGREHLPAAAPFVMVANHASHLDALALGTALPWRLRCAAFPIAAGDTFFVTPATSVFAAMMLNALPMWRKNCGAHAMAALRERLVGDPAIFILFPEGTRTRTGEMAAFKPGLGMILGGADVPVVPCHLDGAFAALPPGRRWPRPHRLTLRIGPPLRFHACGNDREGWRKIASGLEAAVRALAPGGESMPAGEIREQ
jgi:1-acyl-sn-glycerol-3-phosphate acyltransferase